MSYYSTTRSPSYSRSYTRSKSPISHRHHPDASLEEIRQVCLRYEKKAAGTLGVDSTGARYVFDLCENILQMLPKIRLAESTRDLRIKHLESLNSEWEDVFNQPYSSIREHFRSDITGHYRDVTPSDVASYLDRQASQITQLKKQVALADARETRSRQHMESALDEREQTLASRANQVLESERQTHATELKIVNERFEREVTRLQRGLVEIERQANSEIDSSKKEYELEMNAVCQIYNETISDLYSFHKEAVGTLQVENQTRLNEVEQERANAELAYEQALAAEKKRLSAEFRQRQAEIETQLSDLRTEHTYNLEKMRGEFQRKLAEALALTRVRDVESAASLAGYPIRHPVVLEEILTALDEDRGPSAVERVLLSHLVKEADTVDASQVLHASGVPSQGSPSRVGPQGAASIVAMPSSLGASSPTKNMR